MRALKAGRATAEQVDDVLTAVEIEANPIRAATFVAASGQKLREDHAARLAALITSPFDRRQQILLLDDLARDPALSVTSFRLIGAARECLGGSRNDPLINRTGVRLAVVAQHVVAPDASTVVALRRLFRWWNGRALRVAISKHPWLEEVLRSYQPVPRRGFREVLAETRVEIMRAGPSAVLSAAAVILAVAGIVATVGLAGPPRTPPQTVWNALADTIKNEAAGEKSPLSQAAFVIMPFPGAEYAELAVASSVNASVFGPAEIAAWTKMNGAAGGGAWLRRSDLSGMPLKDGQLVVVVSYHSLVGQVRVWDLDSRSTLFAVTGDTGKGPTAFGSTTANALLDRLDDFFKGGGDPADALVDRILRAAEASADDSLSTLRVKAAFAQVLQIRGDTKDRTARLREIGVLSRQVDTRRLPESDRRWLEWVRQLPEAEPAQTPAQRWHALLAVKEGAKP